MWRSSDAWAGGLPLGSVETCAVSCTMCSMLDPAVAGVPGCSVLTFAARL